MCMCVCMCVCVCLCVCEYVCVLGIGAASRVAVQHVHVYQSTLVQMYCCTYSWVWLGPGTRLQSRLLTHAFTCIWGSLTNEDTIITGYQAKRIYVDMSDKPCAQLGACTRTHACTHSCTYLHVHVYVHAHTCMCTCDPSTNC